MFIIHSALIPLIKNGSLVSIGGTSARSLRACRSGKAHLYITFFNSYLHTYHFSSRSLSINLLMHPFIINIC